MNRLYVICGVLLLLGLSTWGYSSWTATTTTIADSDMFLFQDDDGGAGSQDAYITWGNMKATISSADVSTTTTGFNGHLSATEDTTQKALDKLDDITTITAGQASAITANTAKTSYTPATPGEIGGTTPAAGTFTTVTADSVTVNPSASPAQTFRDSDGAGATTDDKYAASIESDMTTPTEDAEVSDLDFYYQDAGTKTKALSVDGSENHAEFGIPALAPVKVLSKSANYTLTAAEAKGSLTIATAAMTLTLPTAAAGYSGCLVSGQGSTAIIQLAPSTGDYLVSDGVRGTAATAYASSGAAGDKICWVCADATDCYITSEVGTWAE